MGEEEQNPNSIYIPHELLEEIVIRLPSKSIQKWRTVSKEWRSILESRRFRDKHMSLRKSRKILAAYNCDCGGRLRPLPDSESRFKGDEEIVYIHCDAARLSLTCDGLVCFLEHDWIIVLNPSTRQLRRFPSGLKSHHTFRYVFGLWPLFPRGYWAMGFGRDRVTGRYKVVRICFTFRKMNQKYPDVECGVADVVTGEWKKLSSPRNVVSVGKKSATVNGLVYWLGLKRGQMEMDYKIIALDLHKEEFIDVSVPAQWVSRETQIVNLEDHLAVANTKAWPKWILEICIMDRKDRRWRKIYSISLLHRVVSMETWERLFTPVAVSKRGNLVFCDNQKRLFKYYPRTDVIRCLSLDTCVISRYVENLVPFPLKPSHTYPNSVNSDSNKRISICRLFSRSSWISKVLQWNGFRILDILFTSLVIVGYVWCPL